MENFTVIVIFTDGSSLTKTIDADNFGEACMKIYNDTWRSAFISGFEKKDKNKFN